MLYVKYLINHAIFARLKVETILIAIPLNCFSLYMWFLYSYTDPYTILCKATEVTCLLVLGHVNIVNITIIVSRIIEP